MVHSSFLMQVPKECNAIGKKKIVERHNKQLDDDPINAFKHSFTEFNSYFYRLFLKFKL